MLCRSALSFSILVFTSIVGAAPPSSSKWQNMAKQKQFENYRDTLLSEKIMPFLSTCYNPTCCVPGEADDLRCSLFFDIVTWARAANYSGNVTKENLNIESPQIGNFCSSLSSAFTEVSEKYKYKLSSTTKSLGDMPKCMIACGNATNLHTRAPCSVSLWLLSNVARLQVAPKNDVVENSEEENAALENQSADLKGDKEQLSGDIQHETNLKNESVPAVQPNLKADIQIPFPGKETNKKQDLNNATLATSATKKLIPTISGNKVVSKNAPTVPVVHSSTPQKSEKPTKPKDPEEKTPANDIPPTAASVDAEKKDKVFEPDTEEYEMNPADQMDDFNQDTDDSLTKVDNSDIGASERMSQSVPDNQEVRRIIVDPFKEDPSSNFFYYFLFGMFACVVGYIVYNNKSKILALILEGRRSQPGRGGRRKHTAAYRKLDSNLEEAIMSAPSGRSSQVIY